MIGKWEPRHPIIKVGGIVLVLHPGAEVEDSIVLSVSGYEEPLDCAPVVPVEGFHPRSWPAADDDPVGDVAKIELDAVLVDEAGLLS